MALPLPTHGVSASYKILGRTDADRQAELDSDVDVGAQFVRVDSDLSSQTATETVVNEIVARGMEPLIVLYASTNALTDMAAVQSFVSSQVQKWGSRVRLYEFCNEPDWHKNWTPQSYTTALLGARAAFNTAKATYNPDALLISAGLFKWQDNQTTGSDGNNAAEWVNQMYQAGAKGAFDLLGLHMYDSPSWNNIHNTWNVAFTNTKNVRAIMDANGDQSVPIISTESGGPVGAPYSEAQQASIVTDNINAVAQGKLASFAWYTMRDDTQSSGDGWGMLRLDLTQRPAYTTYKAQYNPAAKAPMRLQHHTSISYYY